MCCVGWKLWQLLLDMAGWVSLLGPADVNRASATAGSRFPAEALLLLAFICCVLLCDHQVLPDMAGWVSLGPADVDGKAAHMWQLKEMQGEKVNTYTFYVAEVRECANQCFPVNAAH
jgi:hypothetical protein